MNDYHKIEMIKIYEEATKIIYDSNPNSKQEKNKGLFGNNKQGKNKGLFGNDKQKLKRKKD